MPSPMFRRPTPQVSMHYFLGQTGEKDMLQAWTRAIEGLDVELERDRQFYAFA